MDKAQITKPGCKFDVVDEYMMIHGVSATDRRSAKKKAPLAYFDTYQMSEPQMALLREKGRECKGCNGCVVSPQ
jgi:hypothetical protein